LDSKTGEEVMGLFQRLHSDFGQTVIIVTHDPFVARHTRRIVRLSDGLITSDTPNPNPIAAGTPRPELEM
jgi:putative ABC transport system ATP-binding protein